MRAAAGRRQAALGEPLSKQLPVAALLAAIREPANICWDRLAGAEFELSRRPPGGAYATVVMCSVGGQQKALKVYRQLVPDLEQTYDAYVTFRQQTRSDNMIDATFCAAAIKVGGVPRAAVLMDRASGDMLAAYVKRHLDRPDVLKVLERRWRNLLYEMEGWGVSHGDLQPANVLVGGSDGDPRLILLDYDSFTSRKLVGSAPTVSGVPDTIHPRWKEMNGRSLAADTVPGLVTSLSLSALAEDKSLWQLAHGGERMLFASEDLKDPEASAVFQRLFGMGGTVAATAKRLAEICAGPPEAIPAFSKVIPARATGGTRPRAPTLAARASTPTPAAPSAPPSPAPPVAAPPAVSPVSRTPSAAIPPLAPIPPPASIPPPAPIRPSAPIPPPAPVLTAPRPSSSTLPAPPPPAPLRVNTVTPPPRPATPPATVQPAAVTPPVDEDDKAVRWVLAILAVGLVALVIGGAIGLIVGSVWGAPSVPVALSDLTVQCETADPTGATTWSEAGISRPTTGGVLALTRSACPRFVWRAHVLDRERPVDPTVDIEVRVVDPLGGVVGQPTTVSVPVEEAKPRKRVATKDETTELKTVPGAVASQDWQTGFVPINGLELDRPYFLDLAVDGQPVASLAFMILSEDVEPPTGI